MFPTLPTRPARTGISAAFLLSIGCHDPLPCHEPDLDAPVVVSTGGRTLTCDCGADPGSVICTDDSCAAREYRFDSASTLEAPLDVEIGRAHV